MFSIFFSIRLIWILISIILWHKNTFKIYLNQEQWFYFSSSSFKFNMFTLLRHVNSLVMISFKKSAYIFINSILWMSLVCSLYSRFYGFDINLFAKSLSHFVILLKFWSAGFKCLIKHHLKHSLSSLFWILMKPFCGCSFSFGNLM